MLSGYLAAGVAFFIVVTWGYAKFLAWQRDLARREAEVERDRAEVAERLARQQGKVVGAVRGDQTEQMRRNEDDRQAIDAGRRDHFDRDWT